MEFKWDSPIMTYSQIRCWIKPSSEVAKAPDEWLRWQGLGSCHSLHSQPQRGVRNPGHCPLPGAKEGQISFLFCLSWRHLRAFPPHPPAGRAQESPLPAHTLLSRAPEMLASASNCQSCPLGSRTMGSPGSSLCASPLGWISALLMSYIILLAIQISEVGY